MWKLKIARYIHLVLTGLCSLPLMYSHLHCIKSWLRSSTDITPYLTNYTSWQSSNTYIRYFPFTWWAHTHSDILPNIFPQLEIEYLVLWEKTESHPSPELQSPAWGLSCQLVLWALSHNYQSTAYLVSCGHAKLCNHQPSQSNGFTPFDSSDSHTSHTCSNVSNRSSLVTGCLPECCSTDQPDSSAHELSCHYQSISRRSNDSSSAANSLHATQWDHPQQTQDPTFCPTDKDPTLPTYYLHRHINGDSHNT